jgi:hypothetical protein
LHLGIFGLASLFAILLLASGTVSADPPLASTFIGGSGVEDNYRSVRDGDGNIYVASTTSSTDFPTTPGVHGPTYFGGAYDLYVAKLDPSLTTLLAATFVGGSGDESRPALAITSDGSLLVGGATLSTDIPVTSGAYQATKNANEDVFVVKLSSDLTTVLAATYLGGSGTESWGNLVIDVDSSDNAVLGFRSTSSDFPTTPGAYDTTYNDYAPGHGDVVVAKLDGSLSTLMASTFIGGALWDEARVLHVAPDDTVLVGGDTQNSTSYGAHYPTTPGAYSTCSNHAFSREVFVSRLSSDLSTLMASTCIGRYGVNDLLYGVSTTPGGSVLLIGRTDATDFPTTAGAYDTSHNGGSDAFVAILDGSLSTLTASTFLGGSGGETPVGLLIDPMGRIHVAGSTGSADFPITPDGFDTVLNGTSDGFHVRFDPNLENLLYGTFIGGSVEDSAAAPFLIGGQLYVHGWSRSADFPTSPGAYDESHNGEADGIVFSWTSIGEHDYGDAPDPTFPTLLASGGAAHLLGSGLHLGATVDGEADGQPSANADGDDLDGSDDEDGVTFSTPIGGGFDAGVDVVASGAGLLNAWLDFNADGDWADAGEQVFTDQAVAAGDNPLGFAVPVDAAVGTTFARFRISSSGGLSYDGFASDGEVEDHLIQIDPSRDLEVAVGDSPDPVPEGGRLVYHIAVWTNGELDSSTVALTHDIPAESAFVGASHGGCSENGGVVTCDLGTVSPGSPTQLEIEVDVAFGTTGTISSTTAVSSPDGDLFPANNSTTQTTTVVDEPSYVFADGFELGHTTRWSATLP